MFFIYEMRKRGARAALPAVVAKRAPLEFRAWWPGVAMIPGVFDLPIPQSPALRPDALLIPPVGFGTRGYRLGHGGGSFDRALASMNPQPHDVPMDFIVTERGVHCVTPTELTLMADLAAVGAAVAALLSKCEVAGSACGCSGVVCNCCLLDQGDR